MTTPSSVPAQGEALEVLRLTTDALMELLDDTQHKDHPDCEDGYCPVRDGRQALADAIAFFDRARALVAASPCAAQGATVYDCRECGWSGHTESNCPRCAGEVTTASAAAQVAAQGGQQPDDEFSALYQRAMREPGIAELASVIAPAGPAAPLTDEDRQRAFESLPDMPDGFLKKWGWLHFAKAIESACAAKWGITLAGTAQKESEHG